MFHKKFIADLRRAAAMFAFVFFVVPGRCPAEDGDNNWQENGRLLDTLRFNHSFVDSLERINNVGRPETPLRMLPEQGFSRGEELVYDVSWGPFKAGYVIMTAVPDSINHTIKLGGRAVSRGFVNTFYRMRDYVQSTIDADGFYPLFFEQHLREGKHFKADNWILYDHSRDSVFVKDGKFLTLKAPRFTHDFISVMYYIRTRRLAPGDAFSIPVCVDKKIRTINITCRKRETIEVGGKNLACLDLLPRIQGDNGMFSKNSIEVWVTDDSLKVPVKIRFKIKVGSVSATLIHGSRPQPVKAVVAARHDSARIADSPKTHDSSARSALPGRDSGSDSGRHTARGHLDSGVGPVRKADSFGPPRIAPAIDSAPARGESSPKRFDSGKESSRLP